MLEQGFSSIDIENAMLEFGMPMGLFQVLEKIGIDTAYKVSKILEVSFGSRMKVSDTFKESTEKIIFNADSSRSCTQGRDKRRFIVGSTRENLRSYQDIVERLLEPIRREAVLSLEEGVVETREVIDLTLLLGIGFPSSKRIWKQ